VYELIQQWGAVVVGILAAVSIVLGAHISLRPSRGSEESYTVTRVFAFGTGAFFTAVCLDFLPDAWSGSGDSTPLWLFLGAFVLWAATNASDTWFNREQNQQLVASSSATAQAPDNSGSTQFEANDTLSDSILKFTPVSAVVLTAALSFHTFLEGAAVALAFHHLNWNTLGFALAMILHKLPEGVLWGLALAAVFPRDRTKIRRVLIIPAVCTLVGVFLGIFLADQDSSQVINVATGFVAGAMFYIAFAELLPALRDSAHPRLTRNWFVIGLVVMFILNSLSNVFGG
jgi:zinc transporter ZupT